MKRNNLFIAAFVLIAAFSSCKKESTIAPADPVTPVAPNARLLLSSADSYNTYAFEYNADKTVKTYIVNGVRCEYIYQPNKMIVEQYFNNVKRGLNIYELSKGIAQKSSFTVYDANGNVTDVYTTIYTYNTKGLLVREQYTKNGALAGTADITYDNNNDMTLYKATDPNGVITSNSTFEYDLSLPEKSGSFGQSSTNCTGSVFPKKSQHMIKKQTALISGKNYYFSYTMDGAGYVLSGITKDDASVTVGTTTNTWQ